MLLCQSLHIQDKRLQEYTISPSGEHRLVGSILILNKVESRVGKLYDLTTSYINPDRLPTLQYLLLLLWDAPDW